MDMFVVVTNNLGVEQNGWVCMYPLLLSSSSKGIAFQSRCGPIIAQGVHETCEHVFQHNFKVFAECRLCYLLLLIVHDVASTYDEARW